MKPLQNPQTGIQQLEDRQRDLRDQHEKLIGELMVEMENELQLQQLSSQLTAQMAKTDKDILKVCLLEATQNCSKLLYPGVLLFVTGSKRSPNSQEGHHDI